MVDIILSIKPKYAEKILTGEKKVEFRKQIPKQKFSWVYIYASSPNKKIVGRFKVKNEIKGSPEEVWEKCGSSGGIEQENYFLYCNGNKIIYGLEVAEIKRIDPPIDPYLKNSNFKPPQNFAYI
jgi:type I restriction enzyme S subunit